MLIEGERQEKETKKAMQACNDYLRLGPGRSLAKLHHLYTEDTPEKPPTRSINTLKRWSTDFDWPTRATAYDIRIEQLKTAEAERRQLEAMQTGLALDYERVLKLKHLASTLAAEIWADNGEFIQDAVWVPDVKQIGGGEFAERVDIVRFNRPILEEFRAILDDLAKETGGRRQKTDLDVTSGGEALDKMADDILRKIYGNRSG